jgi:hypothetical protein
MKTSFSTGFVEVESCIVSKTIFVTTYFGHHSVLSSLFQFYIKSFIHVISQKNIWMRFFIQTNINM